LNETMGILPEIKSFLELGIPIVEDISQSVFATYPTEEQPEKKEGGEQKAAVGKKAGMYVFMLFLEWKTGTL
ncbi:MAG: hypothetical protein SOV76_03810, partial [Treponema succinifaciens]|nr:hypothetical protein [Treponema succinifaciens]